MMHTLIFIALIISSAMMIIGNNLASAFGLVGAVSIIRFRTVVKSARDMSFVLFAVVAGMSCGLGYLLLALIGLFFTGFIMVSVYFFPVKKVQKKDDLYRIKINYKGAYSEKTEIEKILNEQCRTFSFNTMKMEDGKITFTYIITLENIDLIQPIIASIEDIPQLEKIKILFSNLEPQT
jgi:Domain of unknown function (DUF4956)